MKQFEPFRLDAVNGCLWRGSVQIPLPPKPFAVLEYLVDRPGRLVTHDELLDALWPETFVQPQVLRTYMLELRKLLGDDAGQPRFIQTLPKRGYCFVAPVTEMRASAPGAAYPCEIKPAGFVNRSNELQRLKADFDHLNQAQRRVVFITGEAGIGKTALVDAFCRPESLGQAIAVARGQCVPGVGIKEEYYPVMEALGQLCASDDGDAACRALLRIAPAWLARLGRSGDAAAGAPGERMPGDLCAALEELAAAKPLILVLEDLHWADDATLNLLSALAMRRAPARLMVLATCRSRGIAAGHALKALRQNLRVRKLCEEIALAPLTRASVNQLVSGELKQDELPEGLSAFVHRHSEGNPLFAIAILEHLIAQGCLGCSQQDGATVWELRTPLDQAGAGVPDELAQMVELEIERLTPLEQSMLEAGSLTAVAFSAWAVAAALEKDAAEIEELCDGVARRVHFVERAGEDELPDGHSSSFYVFAHGLYREVLYQRQAASRRARRHERIAFRLGEMFAGREADVAREMAVHYEAAANWQRAAAALRSAARHAEQRQAQAEAADLREHAQRMENHLKAGADGHEAKNGTKKRQGKT
ncbi:MAG TPA: AAA family ATPase [Terracidiphilus sp.]|jgi:predicted ATPase|nr:AAA family ATPase [Terracidiphilus sp.]